MDRGGPFRQGGSARENEGSAAVTRQMHGRAARLCPGARHAEKKRRHGRGGKKKTGRLGARGSIVRAQKPLGGASSVSSRRRPQSVNGPGAERMRRAGRETTGTREAARGEDEPKVGGGVPQGSGITCASPTIPSGVIRPEKGGLTWGCSDPTARWSKARDPHSGRAIGTAPTHDGTLRHAQDVRPRAKLVQWV